jgi:hypothetical protein
MVTRLAQACFSWAASGNSRVLFAAGALVAHKPPRYSGEQQRAQPLPGLRLLIQAVSLMLFCLLLVPPSPSTKLRKINIGFGRGCGHAGEDGYRHEGRNDCLHDHSPSVGELLRSEPIRNTHIISSALTKRDTDVYRWQHFVCSADATRRSGQRSQKKQWRQDTDDEHQTPQTAGNAGLCVTRFRFGVTLGN